MNAVAPHGPVTRTTCPYCGVGCGLLVQPDGRGGASVAGDPMHPANFGRTCSKGSALGETLSTEGRLLHPMVRLERRRARARVVGRRTGSRRERASRIPPRNTVPGAVAFYLSGQLLTEDYYVANKLMKGFLGSANVDTNSRLCMASSVAGHRRAFGADTVPGTYADLDEADLIVLVGSNAAWCHPVLYQRIVQNKAKRGARIVVIDPRRTVSADEADLFLPIAPGTDTALFCGLLVHLADTLGLDYEYIDLHTDGFADALVRAREIAPDLAATARATGLREQDVAYFFDLFYATARVVTCYSQGVNQSAQGTDKVNAIINCHLATGRIGKPGMGPFSLTGQPNAMGGREVGGLANQLAAHMGFTALDTDRVRRFWHAPRIATAEGRKAVDMFEAIARGEIKALWVMATNPAVSLPRAGAVREALKRLDLFVVSENVRSNDTVNAGAHVLLPAAAWGEKDGTVTNSERRISRQRAFLPLPGEAQPDWAIVADAARRMGFAKGFDYGSAAAIFREHAALSAYENGGTRDFDIGALATLSDAAYDGLDPVQWPLSSASETAVREAPPVAPPPSRPRSSDRLSSAAAVRRNAALPSGPLQIENGEKRFFGNGGFFTPDRRARFIASEPPALKENTSADYPLRLNTGRIRDQWHTMTRTGLSPRLAIHRPEPFVEVHPGDATTAGLTDGAFARITTAHGACTVRVIVSEGQQPGSLFMPIHWSDETASQARVGDLVSAQTDPFSGQPEAKATPAAIAPVRYALGGFLRTRHAVALPEGTWWARVTRTNGSEYRLATRHGPLVWHDFAHRALGGDARISEQVLDQTYQAGAFVDGHLDSCLSIGPAETPPRWDVTALTATEDNGDVTLTPPQSSDVIIETETIVCACFGVGVDAVRDAITCGKARTVAEIGRALKAGTQCGSCLPELKRMIIHERLTHPD